MNYDLFICVHFAYNVKCRVGKGNLLANAHEIASPSSPQASLRTISRKAGQAVIVSHHMLTPKLQHRRYGSCYTNLYKTI